MSELHNDAESTDAPETDVPETTGTDGETVGDLTVAELRDWLREWVSEATGMPADQISEDRPMEEFGLSSRDAVALGGDLDKFGGSLRNASTQVQVYENRFNAGQGDRIAKDTSGAIGFFGQTLAPDKLAETITWMSKTLRVAQDQCKIVIVPRDADQAFQLMCQGMEIDLDKATAPFSIRPGAPGEQYIFNAAGQTIGAGFTAWVRGARRLNVDDRDEALAAFARAYTEANDDDLEVDAMRAMARIFRESWAWEPLSQALVELRARGDGDDPSIVGPRVCEPSPFANVQIVEADLVRLLG